MCKTTVTTDQRPQEQQQPQIGAYFLPFNHLGQRPAQFPDGEAASTLIRVEAAFVFIFY